MMAWAVGQGVVGAVPVVDLATGASASPHGAAATWALIVAGCLALNMVGAWVTLARRRAAIAASPEDHALRLLARSLGLDRAQVLALRAVAPADTHPVALLLSPRLLEAALATPRGQSARPALRGLLVN